MDEKRINEIKDFLKANGGGSLPEVQEKFSLGYDEARELFDKLCKEQFIRYKSGLDYAFVPEEDRIDDSDDFDIDEFLRDDDDEDYDSDDDSDGDLDDDSDDSDDSDDDGMDEIRAAIARRRSMLLRRMQMLAEEDEDSDDDNADSDSDDSDGTDTDDGADDTDDDSADDTDDSDDGEDSDDFDDFELPSDYDDDLDYGGEPSEADLFFQSLGSDPDDDHPVTMLDPDDFPDKADEESSATELSEDMIDAVKRATQSIEDNLQALRNSFTKPHTTPYSPSLEPYDTGALDGDLRMTPHTAKMFYHGVRHLFGFKYADSPYFYKILMSSHLPLPDGSFFRCVLIHKKGAGYIVTTRCDAVDMADENPILKQQMENGRIRRIGYQLYCIFKENGQLGPLAMMLYAFSSELMLLHMGEKG